MHVHSFDWFESCFFLGCSRIWFSWTVAAGRAQVQVQLGPEFIRAGPTAPIFKKPDQLIPILTDFLFFFICQYWPAAHHPTSRNSVDLSLQIQCLYLRLSVFFWLEKMHHVLKMLKQKILWIKEIQVWCRFTFSHFKINRSFIFLQFLCLWRIYLNFWLEQQPWCENK